MGFELGDKCLAFHGPLLYEAKILKIWDLNEKKIVKLNLEVPDAEDDEAPEGELAEQECYFIHYQGWKASWDEWIGLVRIREYNDENVALKKQLVQEARDAKKEQLKQKKRKQVLSFAVGQDSASSKKQKASGTQESGRSSSKSPMGPDSNAFGFSGHGKGHVHRHGSDSNNLPKVIMHIPTKLKSVLVNDWEFVTKDKKICALPAAVTVDYILKEYERDISTMLESPATQSQLTEYCEGLKVYFEESLPVFLLYRLERLQFDEMKSKDELCKKYGSIHLLRLLSILSELMSNTTMDIQSYQLIVKQTEAFFEWLLSHDSKLHLFPNPETIDNFYVNTSSQYEGVALGM